ncbi:MAG: hypothetical protein MJ089_01135 [Ruminococcus sp.]|nr:hypothetical protein [Ruminococcus sp.]
MDEEKYYGGIDVEPWEYDSKDYAKKKKRTENFKTAHIDNHYQQMDNRVNGDDRYSRNYVNHTINSDNNSKYNISDSYKNNTYGDSAFNNAQSGNVYSIISLVIGIVSLISNCMFGIGFNIILPVIGLRLGKLAREKNELYGTESKYTKIAIRLNIISLILGVLTVIALIAFSLRF